MSLTSKKVEAPSFLGTSRGLRLAKLADDALSKHDRVLAAILVDQAYKEFENDLLIMAHLEECQRLCVPQLEPINAEEISRAVSSREHLPQPTIRSGKSPRRAENEAVNWVLAVGDLSP